MEFTSHPFQVKAIHPTVMSHVEITLNEGKLYKDMLVFSLITHQNSPFCLQAMCTGDAAGKMLRKFYQQIP